MLREFIKCNSLAERIHVIEKSVPADWNQSELTTVSRIVGVSEEVKGMDTQETLDTMIKALSGKLDEELSNLTEAKEITRLAQDEVPEKEEVSYLDFVGKAMVVTGLAHHMYP